VCTHANGILSFLFHYEKSFAHQYQRSDLFVNPKSIKKARDVLLRNISAPIFLSTRIHKKSLRSTASQYQRSDHLANPYS